MAQTDKLVLTLDGSWKDLWFDVPPFDLGNEASVYVDATFEAEAVASLRFCFTSATKSGWEGDFWAEYSPGRSIFTFSPRQIVGRGGYDGKGVNRIIFGGQGTGTLTIAFAVSSPAGLLVGVG